MNAIMKLAMAAASFSVACGASAASATSSPTVTWIDPSASLFWKTITQTPVAVSVDWPKDAASARLTASSDGETLASVDLSDKTLSECSLSFVLPQDETAERVVDLSLVYYDSAGIALSDAARTARVGLVRGTCGTPFRCIPTGDSCGVWKKVKGGSAVVPVPEGTENLSLDGSQLAFGVAPDWARLFGLATGSHVLSKTDSQAATVDVPLSVGGGLLLLVR